MSDSDDTPKKVKYLPAKLIRTDGKTALVETLIKGKYNRVSIPAKEFSNGKISEETFNQGIPYGLPWHEWEPIPFDHDEFANELHRAGVYTAEDFKVNQHLVYTLLEKFMGVQKAQLRQFVKNYS